MGKRAEALELAVLGLLHDAPMHGYELRKQVNASAGLGSGVLIRHALPLPQGARAPRDSWPRTRPVRRLLHISADRRSKIVYKLTPEGKERFADLLAQAGPSSWDDEQFGVHFAFFARADAATRMRILEGRRTRLQERLEQFRSALQRTRERLDAYTLELQSHGLESVEREVRWLDELIAASDKATSGRNGRPAGSPVRGAKSRERHEVPSGGGNCRARPRPPREQPSGALRPAGGPAPCRPAPQSERKADELRFG